jgi:ankyrin repeat protein
MLLKHKNIDVNLQDKDGNTALNWACARDQEEIVAILLQDERINIDLQNNEGQSALVIALIVRESKRQS